MDTATAKKGRNHTLRKDFTEPWKSHVHADLFRSLPCNIYDYSLQKGNEKKKKERFLQRVDT